MASSWSGRCSLQLFTRFQNSLAGFFNYCSGCGKRNSECRRKPVCCSLDCRDVEVIEQIHHKVAVIADNLSFEGGFSYVCCTGNVDKERALGCRASESCFPIKQRHSQVSPLPVCFTPFREKLK